MYVLSYIIVIICGFIGLKRNSAVIYIFLVNVSQSRLYSLRNDNTLFLEILVHQNCVLLGTI
jgi:hypothetical protein